MHEKRPGQIHPGAVTRDEEFVGRDENSPCIKTPFHPLIPNLNFSPSQLALLLEYNKIIMSVNPAFILVPGAWHSADTWRKVVSGLQAQQHNAIPITLPSTTGDPSAGLGEDVQAVRSAILTETTQGRDVVVVVHSYGGLVGESAIKGLTTRHDEDDSSSTGQKKGLVVGLALIATGFAMTGVSFIEGAGGKPPPFWTPDAENEYAVLVVDTRQLFYHDLPEDEGNYWVGKLEKQSLKSLFEGGEHAYAGWKDVPVWYLATVEDKALPVEAQRMFVQMAKDAGGHVTMREVESSHSPMLSREKETAEFLLEAAKAFVK